jgi:UDP-N-acetylmuramate dehydrogenase
MVIRNTNSCTEIEICGNEVRVGSSVRLQDLILTCSRSGLGGIEYLYSVPGNVGGALVMNAGRGAAHGQFIGNSVVEVEWFDGKTIRHSSARHCRFRYRDSRFLSDPRAIVLSARLKLDPTDAAVVRRRVRERMQLVKESQDNICPNAGSVFKSGLVLAAKLMGQSVGEVQFSSKTPNWILNRGGTLSAGIFDLISHAKDMHKRAGFREPVLEWVVP